MSIDYDLLYNELFEYRLNLLNDYNNEVDIIRELKYYLLDTFFQNNDYNDTINTILYDFYQFFNINVSLEAIQEITIPQNIPHENQPNEEELPALEEVPNINPPVLIQNNNMPMQNIFNNIFQNFIQNIPHEQPNVIPNHNIPIFQNIMLPPYYQPHFELPIFQGRRLIINNNNVNVIDDNIHDNMINMINQFLGGIQPNYENVKVATDEEDIMKLKSITLENKMDYDCTICMGCMEKDEVVIELDCKHTYHKDCIEPYLKDYNYKCPICRQEVGKSKAHI